MLETLTTIREIIPELFPSAMGFQVQPDTLLSEIPNGIR